jgi:hypothetical protein
MVTRALPCSKVGPVFLLITQLFVYLTTLFLLHMLYSIYLDGKIIVNGEYIWIWKEAVVYCLQIFSYCRLGIGMKSSFKGNHQSNRAPPQCVRGPIFLVLFTVNLNASNPNGNYMYHLL